MTSPAKIDALKLLNGVDVSRDGHGHDEEEDNEIRQLMYWLSKSHCSVRDFVFWLVLVQSIPKSCTQTSR